MRNKQFHISGLFFVHEMSKFWVATCDYLGTEHWQSLYHMPSQTQYHSNVSQTGCDLDHAEKYYIASICYWLKFFTI